MTVALPHALHNLAAKVINSVVNGSLPLPDLKPIENWLEDDGWDEVVRSVQGSCVYLDHIASDFFNDDCIREHLDSDDVHITDEMRIQFGHTFIDDRLEQSEDTVHAVELNVSPHPSVFLDCMIIGQGQGGWLLEWGTVYKSVHELLESYKKLDAVIGSSAEVSNKKILELWNYGMK